MSGLQDGTSKFKYSFLFLILKPRLRRIFSISLLLQSKPVIFLNKEIGNLIFLFLNCKFLFISILLILPPQIFCISSAPFIKPSSIELGSIPLSNLYLASVSIFKIFAVFLIDLGSK